MNERQHRLYALDPDRVATGQIRSGIGRRGKDPEVFREQRGGHHHGRGLVEDLAGRRTHPEPHAADPGTNSRVFGKSADKLGQGRGRRLGRIEYPERSAIHGRETGDALRREVRRFSRGGSGSELRAHDGPPTSRATNGAILSTSTATPRSLG